jgi:hypothetical protein
MSHPATLSPSPMNFGDPSTSNFFSSSRFPTAPANNDFASFFDRRRTSHPHNQPLQRASEEMADRSQSQQRPRLEHRASQTIIDLTDDPEDMPVPPRQHVDRSRSRPPQLGRSDAVSLGDFIDLTDDNGEPDLIIMGGRQLPLPRPSAARPVPLARRDDSPSLFVPLPPRPINRVFPAHRHGGFVVTGRIERHGLAQIPPEARYTGDSRRATHAGTYELSTPCICRSKTPACCTSPSQRRLHAFPGGDTDDYLPQLRGGIDTQKRRRTC